MSESRDYVEIAHGYARDVVAGVIPASHWVRRACQRHLDDMADEALPYRFDEAKAHRACAFIELLPHTKGRWASRGQLLRLEPWQVFFVASIFGWVKRSDGLRRFRRALLLVPRKNGKSALAAGIGLYMLLADGEAGPEIYSGATTRLQAMEVFTPARHMCEALPALRKAFKIQVNKEKIICGANNGFFAPVIGKPGDGSSPSCAITDEYHEHKDDSLVNTMETGMGAREQPLSLIITTAGSNMAGPCYALQVDAQQMLDGVARNDRFFALIYGIDRDDDWTKDAALAKANPNLGASLTLEDLVAERNEALRASRRQGTFKTKRLNVWVGARSAYFDMQRWGSCADPDVIDRGEMDGRDVIIGLDLASKLDIASMAMLFPQPDGHFVVSGRHFVPENTVAAGDRAIYRGWVEDGDLIATDGDMIDFERIEAEILDACKRYNVLAVAYDPFQATYLVTRLMAQGVNCVQVRQTVLMLSEPMKTLEASIIAGKIRHDDNRALNWMMSNVTTLPDAKDNVYPRKEAPENKIDGAVALIIALAYYLNTTEPAPQPFTYVAGGMFGA